LVLCDVVVVTAVGDVERVTELIDLLDKVKRDKQHQTSSHVKTGDCIRFEAVDIVTPAGVDLVNNLSFSLAAGESLLLVGHNGAGKSSIFRCLGSLWNVASGTITKPPISELFYIPQKPYNVLGTLKDQLYYPQNVQNAQLSCDDLREILAQVDLEHLLDRAGALTDEINWEDELSLGEKQRLAIARLLLQKPRFAILDECSSAISDEMTHRLYKICQAQATAYITIAHRPALKAYHDRLLSIGDGRQGFTLEAIPKDVKLAAQEVIAASAKAADGADALLRAQLKKRSAKYAGDDVENQEGKGLPQRSMLARGWRIIKLGWIDYTLLRLASSFTGIFVQVWMQNYQMLNVGHMFGCLMIGDMSRMLRLSRNSLLLCFFQPIIYESVLFLQREIGHDMMERAQDYLMERLLKNENYYKMSQIDGRIKDTKQRVCGDCHEVFHHFDSLVVSGK
jgi:ABC-type multidrug transport system ATPase subunit